MLQSQCRRFRCCQCIICLNAAKTIEKQQKGCRIITDEPNNPPVVSNPPTVNYNADPITNSASFKNKNSITGKTSSPNQENGQNTEQRNTKINKNLKIAVLLKHFSNFRRTLGIPLINCEVSFTLTWSENCILTDITTQTA